MADFYAARDNTMKPLPWKSIAPPFTGALIEARQIFDDLLTPSEADNAVLAAVLAVRRLIRELGVDMEVVIFFNYADQIEVIEL